MAEMEDKAASVAEIAEESAIDFARLLRASMDELVPDIDPGPIGVALVGAAQRSLEVISELLQSGLISGDTASDQALAAVWISQVGGVLYAEST